MAELAAMSPEERSGVLAAREEWAEAGRAPGARERPREPTIQELADMTPEAREEYYRTLRERGVAARGRERPPAPGIRAKARQKAAAAYRLGGEAAFAKAGGVFPEAVSLTNEEIERGKNLSDAELREHIAAAIEDGDMEEAAAYRDALQKTGQFAGPGLVTRARELLPF
jgi:hypothetical protein